VAACTLGTLVVAAKIREENFNIISSFNSIIGLYDCCERSECMKKYDEQ